MGNKQSQKDTEQKSQPLNPPHPGFATVADILASPDPFMENQRKKQITVQSINFDQAKTTSNAQDAKLQLLVFGYLRQNIGKDFDKTVDIELINQSAVWLCQTLSVQFRTYYGTRRYLPLEIWLEGDEFNILNPTNVKQYVIKYFDGENGVIPSVESAKENEENAEVVCTSFIYPFNCLSFTSRHDIGYDHQYFTFIKIMAIDNDDRIIASTEWTKISNNINSVTYSFPAPDYYETLLKYWSDNICKKSDTEFVDVNQWIEAVMDSDVGFTDDEGLAKKLFYLILFGAGKGDNKSKEGLLMGVKDFDVFVSDGTYDEYTPKIARFARNCWRIIGIGTMP